MKAGVCFNYAVIGVLVATIISVMTSVAPGISFWGFHRKYDGLLLLIVCVFLFYIILCNVKKKDIDGFIWVFIGVGCLCSLYGVYQSFGMDPVDKVIDLDYKRWPGSTFGRAAFFGAYLTVVIPLSFYMLLKFKKWWMYLVVGLLLYALVLTKARASFVGVFVGMLYFVLLCRCYISFRLIGVVLGFIIILNVVLPESPVKRLIEYSSARETRHEIWHVGYSIIKDNRWFGIGPDCLPLVYGNYRIAEYGEVGALKARLHNEWLDILVDTGIIGLVAWLSFYVQYFRLSWYGRNRMVTIALSSSLLGYLVQNQFSFGMIPNILVMWYLVGLTVVSVRSQ